MTAAMLAATADAARRRPPAPGHHGRRAQPGPGRQPGRRRPRASSSARTSARSAGSSASPTGSPARFGEQRVFDTPLAESGIVGTAIGMAMNGLVPVVEMQFDAFAYPAFEQVTSHLAKLRNRTRGRVALPVVIRVPFGGGIGGVEHHCDSSEAYYTHTPGLRVVTPGTPADAYRLLRQAIDCPDPVIFLEPKRRYWSKETAVLTADGPADRPGGDPAAGPGRHAHRLRRDGGHRAGGRRGRRRGGLGRRGHRPALAVAVRRRRR